MIINKRESAPCWGTAATNHSASTSPAELSALGSQLDECHEMRGVWFTLRCYIDTYTKFAASHLLTTALFMVLVVSLFVLAS